MVETEIKFQLTRAQHDAILAVNRGAPHDYVHQVDTYYAPPGDGVSLRVREEETVIQGGMLAGERTACLTIKKAGGAADSGVYSSQEIEPQLPGQSGDVIKGLLQTLGIPQDIVVDKWRTEFSDEGCKMCLDDVKGLGCFMEIEVLGESEADAQAKVGDIIRRYGFDNLPVAGGGYPSLLKKKLARL